MGLKLSRQKKRNFLLVLFYRLNKLLFFLSPTKKLKFLLDLSWISSRLAQEQYYKVSASIKNTEPETDDFLISKIRENQKVLDLGCGRGNVSSKLLPKTKNITGIDYDKIVIEEAKKKINIPQVKFICEDVFDYLKNNPEEYFDVIILSHIVEHIENPKDFLTKLLNKSSFFYIEVPDFQSSYLNQYRLYVDTDLIYSDADHVSEFDRKELSDLIKSIGLNIIDSEFKFGVMKFWVGAQSNK